MFIGINCSEQKSTLDSGTRTAWVCAPESCSGSARAEFDELLCQESIVEDLRFYHTVLSAQPHSLGLLATTVLHAPRELLNACFPSSLQESPLTSQAPPGGESSFDQRLSLCKVLKGLQARSLTINRALSYLHAEDHRKGPSRK
ncbi:interleukin-12 subunit alpha-like [Osmerus mordax]|uniref:interleukin-12 subunit alpha-like n=1 Tax=Osmerus mordax TaxID=8014 RepID=UPI00350EC5E9